MSDPAHVDVGGRCSCGYEDAEYLAQHVALTPLQRGILETFFAVQDHGHFSPEAQAAAAESLRHIPAVGEREEKL